MATTLATPEQLGLFSSQIPQLDRGGGAPDLEVCMYSPDQLIRSLQDIQSLLGDQTPELAMSKHLWAVEALGMIAMPSKFGNYRLSFLRSGYRERALLMHDGLGIVHNIVTRRLPLGSQSLDDRERGLISDAECLANYFTKSFVDERTSEVRLRYLQFIKGVFGTLGEGPYQKTIHETRERLLGLAGRLTTSSRQKDTIRKDTNRARITHPYPNQRPENLTMPLVLVS